MELSDMSLQWFWTVWNGGDKLDWCKNKVYKQANAMESIKSTYCVRLLEQPSGSWNFGVVPATEETKLHLQSLSLYL